RTRPRTSGRSPRGSHATRPPRAAAAARQRERGGELVARAGTAYIDIEGNWRPFNRQFTAQVSRLESQSSGLGRKIGIGLGAGLAIAAAIGTAADFEQQISALGSVADATGRQMEQLRQQAIRAGADTKFSALEAAAAQTELAKGGLSVAQIMKGGLRSALALA